MNSVLLIGRLTRDPAVSYGAQSQMAVCRFTIAIDRGKDRNGEDKGADFPSIVCFGKTAELCERYLSKGRLVGISGRLQTGSYEKDGRKVYTTDVLADRVEFLDRGDRSDNNFGESRQAAAAQSYGEDKGFSSPSNDTGFDMGGFTKLTDDDIPF